MRHEYYWKNARSKICNGESAHLKLNVHLGISKGFEVISVLELF